MFVLASDVVEAFRNTAALYCQTDGAFHETDDRYWIHYRRINMTMLRCLKYETLMMLQREFIQINRS